MRVLGDGEWGVIRNRTAALSAPILASYWMIVLGMTPSLGFAQTGALTQLAGTAGCISDSGTEGNCTVGSPLFGLFAVGVSPNGKQVYSTTVSGDNSIVAFTRVVATGVLKQPKGKKKRCVSSDGSNEACTIAAALSSIRDVAFSPDGKFAYAASSDIATFAAFRRLSLGQLKPLTGTAGCVSDDTNGGACVEGRGLGGVFDIVVSPDGKNVYTVATESDAVTVFTRNLTTGAVTQLNGMAGCISDTGSEGCADGVALDRTRAVAVSPDGKNIYVASAFSDAVAIFSRDVNTGALAQLAGTAGCISEDGSSGACVDGKGLDGARGVAVSADGKNVYVVASDGDAVAVFTRDVNTGALTQFAGTSGCISWTGGGGACVVGRGLDGVEGIAVSGDGKNVYVAGRGSNAVVVFARDGNTGALTQLSGMAGCVNEAIDEGCAPGVALLGARSVVVSLDGKHVYVGADSSYSVAVFSRQP